MQYFLLVVPETNFQAGIATFMDDATHFTVYGRTKWVAFTGWSNIDLQ